MRTLFLAVSLMAAASCVEPEQSQESPKGSVGTPAAASQAAPERSAPGFPLRVDGTGFVDSAGREFQWRGVTAFRLAEMLASGRETEVVAYLDWAASRRLNVVRVLLMAHHLFRLTPDAGLRTLPRLLDLAKERGIAVEVVALADTQEVDVDFDAHVREIGRIALDKGNALVEIANEPGHATQDERLHNPAELKRLASLLPGEVIVAYGSAEYDQGYAAGDYATFHFPREPEWGHVLALAEGAAMIERLEKPLINDEPIGAAAEYIAGRRDNAPERFGAAAALTRLTGMGGTFHYEGGLQSRIPEGLEEATLDAWLQGLTVPVISGGEFLSGAAVGELAEVSGARAFFARRSPTEAAVLLVDPAQGASVAWRAGWKEARRHALSGALLITATR